MPSPSLKAEVQQLWLGIEIDWEPTRELLVLELSYQYTHVNSNARSG